MSKDGYQRSHTGRIRVMDSSLCELERLHVWFLVKLPSSLFVLCRKFKSHIHLTCPSHRTKCFLEHLGDIPRLLIIDLFEAFRRPTSYLVNISYTFSHIKSACRNRSNDAHTVPARILVHIMWECGSPCHPTQIRSLTKTKEPMKRYHRSVGRGETKEGKYLLVVIICSLEFIDYGSSLIEFLGQYHQSKGTMQCGQHWEACHFQRRLQWSQQWMWHVPSNSWYWHRHSIRGCT